MGYFLVKAEQLQAVNILSNDVSTQESLALNIAYVKLLVKLSNPYLVIDYVAYLKSIVLDSKIWCLSPGKDAKGGALVPRNQLAEKQSTSTHDMIHINRSFMKHFFVC